LEKGVFRIITTPEANQVSQTLLDIGGDVQNYITFTATVRELELILTVVTDTISTGQQEGH
jgi:hypothetical protein